MFQIATTWIKSVGTGKKSTAKSSLQRTMEYVMNPEKTMGGTLVTGYDCIPKRAVDEFLIKKGCIMTSQEENNQRGEMWFAIM